MAKVKEKERKEVDTKSLADGVYIVGLYNGMETFQNERGVSVRVSVLSGRDLHGVYLKDDGGGELQAHDRGETVMVLARPYVNKKNYLTWTDGEIVDWLDVYEDENDIPA